MRTKLEETKQDLKAVGGWDVFKSGDWLLSIVQKSFRNYDPRVTPAISIEVLPFTQIAPPARSRNRPERSSGVHDHDHRRDHGAPFRSRSGAGKLGPGSATAASAIGLRFGSPDCVLAPLSWRGRDGVVVEVRRWRGLLGVAP